MKAKLFFALIIFGVLSCSAPSTDSTIVFDELPESTFADFLSKASFQILPLSTDSQVIGDFYIVKYNEGEIYVFSQKEGKVHRFSAQGDYTNSIGTVGDGPEEYRSPTDFLISGDSIIILNQRKGTSSLNTYSKHGLFINRMDFEESAYTSFAITNSKYLFATSGNIDYGNNHHLHVRDFNGQLKNRFHPIEKRNIPSVWIDNLADYGDDIFYLEAFNNKLYRVKDDSLQLTQSIDFGKFNIEPDAFASENRIENFMKVGATGCGFNSVLL